MIDESGDQVVIEKRFFGEQFLDYVDSIFFYLPFSSASEAEASTGPGVEGHHSHQRME